MDAARGTRLIGVFAPEAVSADLADLIREATAFHEAGASIVDLDTLPGGAFAGVDEDTTALLVLALAESGIPVSVSTMSARIARIAADHGASWIIDPSGATHDRDMVQVVAASHSGWVFGPWPSRLDARDVDESLPDAYIRGLVRNLAGLLEVGVHPDRVILHADAGLSAVDSEPWRMVNHLDRVAALGRPVLIDARTEILTAMTSDDSEDRLDDAAVALALLATGLGAWGIRVERIARVAGALERILEPRQRV